MHKCPRAGPGYGEACASSQTGSHDRDPITIQS
jgi:hypothetical protein